MIATSDAAAAPLALNQSWALVERIAASAQLKRSARLRDLLLYIGRRQLKDGLSHIHEQQIGIDVFGRSDSYDTNLDNIVRANVSELRKRIKAYFETEGRDELLQVEIPRGGYVLVFSRHEIGVRSTETSAPAQRPEAAALADAHLASSTTHISVRTLLWVCGVLMIALLGTVAGLWIQNRDLRGSLDETKRAIYPWRYQPTVASFWSQFVDSSIETDVVVPDALFSQMQYYSRTSIPLKDYIDRSYLNHVEMQRIDPSSRAFLVSVIPLNFVTLNAVTIAQNILDLDPLHRKMHLYYSREFLPNFIDRDNVILLGDPRSDPWMQLVENRLNFTLDRDEGHLGPIVNHEPLAGELSSYQQNDSVGYCVIAYLPNPGHSGKFLLIQGTSPAATEAAEFFLMSETQLSAFMKKLHATTLPYFEVLLKTSQVTGTPLTAAVEAYRIHS